MKLNPRWVVIGLSALILGFVLRLDPVPGIIPADARPEPSGAFSSGHTKGQIDYDLLGNGRLQRIRFAQGLGSHWIGMSYEITDGKNQIFHIYLMTHSGKNMNMWLSGASPPFKLVVYQPWCQDPDNQLDGQMGFREYTYNGRSYAVSKVLLDDRLRLWWMTPMELDL